jgi:hypothetical protein
MKALFLCLGTYKTKDTTGSDSDNSERQLLYAIALSNLSKLVTKDMGILVVENSVASVSELHPPLQEALKLPQVTDVLFSQDNAWGSKNKGAGEYGLCKFAFEKKPELFEQADWIIYYTHRHTMPFPKVFEYLEKYQSYDAVVAAAEYLYPDGSASVPGTDLFDDLIFAMKRETFVKYLETMDPEVMVKKHIGSEQNLYQFLTSQNINYKQVERFGVFRYNYVANRMEVV